MQAMHVMAAVVPFGEPYFVTAEITIFSYNWISDIWTGYIDYAMHGIYVTIRSLQQMTVNRRNFIITGLLEKKLLFH